MNVFKRIGAMRRAKQRSNQRDDYLDWSRIPRAFSYVAIDAVDTGHWKAGQPIAYQREPAFSGGRWLRTAMDMMFMKTDTPEYVPQAAIIGKLPEPAASLRRRPEA